MKDYLVMLLNKYPKTCGISGAVLLGVVLYLL